MARDDGAPPSDVSRRTVLLGAAAGGTALPLLAACGGGSGGSASGATGPVTLAASEVPVGGGVVVPDHKVVVTQPTRGDFKAFTAVCTHQGCLVGSVRNGQIVCPCHHSHFSITDGAVTSGPAPSPLAAKQVTVKGGKVTVA